MMPTADSNQTGIVPGGMTGEHPGGTGAWKEIVIRYQQPSWWRADWQLVNTLVPYLALWYLMYACAAVSYWLVAPLAILTGGLMVLLFIMRHDCGHGLFFKSRGANDVWGFITGALTFAPYHHWRWEHAVHQSSSGNLERSHDAEPLFQTLPPVTRFGSPNPFALRLWDEKRHRLVGFGHLRKSPSG